MLVCAVVTPKVFQPDRFCDPAYTNQACLFLEDMQDNGLILVDHQGVLKKRMADNVDSISDIGGGHRVKIHFAELLSNPRKRFMSSKFSPSDTARNDPEVVAQELAKSPVVDALITTGRSVATTLCCSEQIPLEQYQESIFRSRQKSYCRNGSGDLDKLDRKSVDEIFERTVRFSNRLTFYDKQLGRLSAREFQGFDDGRAASHLGRFFNGIDYILHIWKRCRYPADSAPRVEIVTIRDRSPEEDARKAIISYLLRPLQTKYPAWSFRIVVKEHNSRFHDRLFDAERILIELGKGFDLFDRNRRFCCQCLTVSGRHDYLVDWKSAPTCFEVVGE